VIQVGADVNVRRLIVEVQRLAETFAHHPLLLPIQLFQEHSDTTSRKLREILKKVKDVETKLMAEIVTQKMNIDLQIAGWNFGELSKTLHTCSMDLVELRRRRTFEDAVADALTSELKNHPLLRRLASSEGLAKRHKRDIDSLPERIESQKTLVRSYYSPYICRIGI